MDLTLLILAAGMGSRYGGLKQIDPVGPGGETLLDYSVYDALRAGFDRAVFVIRRDIERDFREAVGGRFEGRIGVDYAFQEMDALPPGITVPPGRGKPWGTGHAVLTAAEQVNGPFVVINADDFYGAGSFEALAGHLRSAAPGDPPEYAMVGFRLRDTLSPHGSVARAICECDTAGFLERIEERTDIRKHDHGTVCTDGQGGEQVLTGDEPVSMNIWGFDPSIFELLGEKFGAFLERAGTDPKAEFYIPGGVNELIGEGRARVKVLSGGGPWFGITYPEDKAAVQDGIRQLIAGGRYPERLWP